jgi:hypothetical protein
MRGKACSAETAELAENAEVFLGDLGYLCALCLKFHAFPGHWSPIADHPMASSEKG